MTEQPIIGLDTSTKGFHWVATKPLYDGSGDGDAQTYGFCGMAGMDADERRQILFTTARQFFRSLPEGGAFVFCEEPLALQNGKTTRLLGLAAGAIWAAHLDFDVTWFWVDVASWKKDVVGKGNASKEQIRAFCLANPAFQHEPVHVYEEQPDLYDAWCLKVYGVRQLAGRS
jgi:hypothetical protein